MSILPNPAHAGDPASAQPNARRRRCEQRVREPYAAPAADRTDLCRLREVAPDPNDRAARRGLSGRAAVAAGGER